MTIRIEVRGKDAATLQSTLHYAETLGIQSLDGCITSQLYFLDQNPGIEALHKLCSFLLVDPVIEIANWVALDEMSQLSQETGQANTHSIEVAPRPGVTDVTARELERGMRELGLPEIAASTAIRYELQGDLTAKQLHLLAHKLLCNETIEQYTLGPITPQFSQEANASSRVESVPLDTLDEEALLTLSRERLLSLDLAEMQAIQSFYRQEGRDPTDVELETLAQTWSEHCVHKTFRAQIDFRWQDEAGLLLKEEEIDGLLDQYIRAATDAVYPPWLYSAFVDDAGIIAFDDHYDLAFKAETHNHPSALEPFGGANTGIGGVVRDIIGVSARPIATTDVLCFGPQSFPYEELPDGVLHPKRIADGVIAGVGDYGNKLGLPTVNGAIIYDEGYLGNPLVFCGCVGLLPHGSHPTEPQIGDQVVVLGGRTGRDGLHGATFSSAELTHETTEQAGSAVQIGDPITEKGVIELIEAARDQKLYTAITDCGAGGLSSSIGEMGETLGVDVELSHVLLKYPGLVPWEIWLSEAQERMVLAVPPQNIDALQTLADQWDVEMSVLGHFTGDGILCVRHEGQAVAQLSMAFLHDGLPRRQMQAIWQESAPPVASPPEIDNFNPTLCQLLAHPSVASKEGVIRQYDHEVRGGTLVRPLTGPEMDGPADAAMLKPLGTWHHNRAFTLSLGINPLIGKLDPYAMAVSAIDEAFRNAVAVGANPDQMAILDNFCWGNPTYPDRLGALVRACQGCYDGAVAYKAPFISGKDSLYNEFNGTPIPPTLLISAIGIVPDMNLRVTSDLKRAGNRLYLLGESKAELGGSLLYDQLGYVGGIAPTMPDAPLKRYRLLHQAIQQGWIESCHDLSEGGLAVALAEMVIAGRLGAHIMLPKMAQNATLSLTASLFSESNGRLLVEVQTENAADLEALFIEQTLTPIGYVTQEQTMIVEKDEENVIELPIEKLVSAWKGPQ